MTEAVAKPRGGHVIELSADEFSAAVSAVTTAFGDPTGRDIYLFVRAGADGVTAAEVAERFDLHPNVARHHLEKLTAGGYLTVELARHETAGRPSKRYRAGELDTSLNFPPRRDDLLATLLARALEMLDPDEAAAMAEEVGYGYGLAFAAHAEASGGTLQIVAEQCPFGDAAKKYPHVVCSVDRGMIRGMLAGLYGDTHPLFTESRPAGDDHCVATV